MNIPYLLVFSRLFLAPVAVWIAYRYGQSANLILFGIIVWGIVSDIFDGIIARHQNISTVQLRRWDSQMDLVFWIAIAVSCYILHPEIIKAHRWGIISVFILEGLCYAVSFIKFGKETCTHAFLSKIWGLLLFSTFVGMIVFSYGGILLKITIIWGIISQLDVILIILLLPKWQNDIPSVYHAYLIRKGRPIKKSKWLNS
ncbi:CDP-alcohol phosphatidyltransferase family protein [Riemerella columbina]|uniref:CDP-alcohol phosphatidyltransferase family protein n=1 Tax=Riemerella columbina TaxID=103810 RepID=UPI0003617761|nr:CDP-alcohol phosphatidyltransferase family protein [Riemerella columbina]